jgi:hypothetical protein
MLPVASATRYDVGAGGFVGFHVPLMDAAAGVPDVTRTESGTIGGSSRRNPMAAPTTTTTAATATGIAFGQLRATGERLDGVLR